MKPFEKALKICVCKSVGLLSDQKENTWAADIQNT